QWERPVLPGSSLRLPTRYQTQNEVRGAPWSSRRNTVRPLSRVWETRGVEPCTGVVMGRTCLFAVPPRGGRGHDRAGMDPAVLDSCRSGYPVEPFVDVWQG